MPEPSSRVRSTVLPHPAHQPVVLETDGSTPSKAPASGLSRAQILEATEACFAEAGYEGTTIRAIAGRLGCSVGSIYRYFEDKRQLLLACAERMLAPAAEAIEAGGTVEASEAVYARQARGHESLYRLRFWLGADARRGVPAIIERILAGWGDRLEDRERTERRWAALHGALMLGRLPEPTAPADATPPATAEEAVPEPGRSGRAPRPSATEDGSLGRAEERTGEEEDEPTPTGASGEDFEPGGSAEPGEREDLTLL
jgi:AcrR family transcriptional regulator